MVFDQRPEGLNKLLMGYPLLYEILILMCEFTAGTPPFSDFRQGTVYTIKSGKALSSWGLRALCSSIKKGHHQGLALSRRLCYGWVGVRREEGLMIRMPAILR